MEWETPKTFYDSINREFHFDLDVCATKETAKCERYYTVADDGLSKEWIGVCWMNPPYDKSIGLWMKKAWESSQAGSLVVCLIQGRSTDTIWWHEYVMRANEIRYIKDRLHFGKNGNYSRANISNILVIFTPHCKGYPTVSTIDTCGKTLPVKNEVLL
jgi:phage N-6-adenine-methyltransferase